MHKSLVLVGQKTPAALIPSKIEMEIENRKKLGPLPSFLRSPLAAYLFTAI